MANTNAPFGFAESSRLGAAVNYQMSTRNIATTNSTAIYFGDPVSLATGTTGLGTGYIKQASASQTQSVTSLSWSAGVMTVNFSAGTIAPAVGDFMVFSGFSTATALNGTWGPVLSSTTTSVTFNFPVTQSTDTGTVVFYQPITGIFAGCEYMSSSLKRRVWSNYWPGVTTDIPASTTIACKVIDDPQTVFRVQGNGNITQAMVGLNATFNIGTGSTVNGVSGATLDVTGTAPAAASPYLQFTITGLIADPPPGGAGNGTDTASAYNWAYVTFNNQTYRGSQNAI